ncbi:MAG: ABC transporter permease [Bacteroidales bacterium]|nr:ABC transporter permease [Bacteroidales bacterium]
MKLRKYLISVQKEALLLLRDIEGVVLIFLMPIILVLVVTLLQHRTFQNLAEVKIPVVLVDYDNDSLGNAFSRGIGNAGIFEVTTIRGTDSSQLQKARQDVAGGKYQIGIVIPEDATLSIKNRVIVLIQQQLPDALKTVKAGNSLQSTISLFFDPVTKESFKELTRASLEKFATSTENRIFITAYSKVIDAITGQQSVIDIPDEPGIVFREDLVSEYTGGVMPNSVQHNVPAWTLFGMFLICIPVAGSIIKERSEGCLARLKTLPISFLNILMPKTIVFVVICLLQALAIFLIGIYLMPVLGLPGLQIGGNNAALFFISFASALAASGFGIAIGSIASTHVQASTFGSVSTVILAAIGGVWVPVMVMPEIMRKISAFSPLNWGVTGYYNVFLRNASTLEVMPEILKLTAFFVICILAGIWFRKSG